MKTPYDREIAKLISIEDEDRSDGQRKDLDTYHLRASDFRQGYAAALASEPVQGLVAAAKEAQVSLGSKALWGRQEALEALKTALAAFEKATKKEEAHGS